MMRILVTATLLTLVAAAWPPANPWITFRHFERQFKRQYESEEERNHRFQIFVKNLDMIKAVNAKNLSYTLGVTNFADLTFDEFKSQYLNGIKPAAFNGTRKLGVFRAPEGFTEPDSVDWTAKGGVTPVKNQGQCGSCWTFSTTGALEGASFIASGTLPILSEQNILDCDDGGNKCGGGSMDQAFDWVGKSGLCSESDYSYQCMDQTSSSCTSATCTKTCTQVLQAGTVTGHTDVAQTEGALEAAVAQQPVSVAIEADQAVFQHYTSGVLTGDACGSTLDHGVLVVGYGTDNGQKYWKVKNSWGTTFGEDGYIRVAKGSGGDGGECGIRKMASFPTVAASVSAALGDEAKFKDFESRFGRQYGSAEERSHRFHIFVQNLRLIEAVNAKNLSYNLGVANFADLTFDEFKSQHLSGIKTPAFKGTLKLGLFRAPEGFAEPDSIDWTAKGAVSPVKNQGACGSCWSFSTTGALEGALFVASGTLTSLSEQNILDCDDGGNKCQGGSMDQAFDWAGKNGLCSESDYPYQCMEAASLACNTSKCTATCTQVLQAGAVTGHTDVDQSEEALEAAVAQQPVSVAIEADQAVFQHYSSGIMTSDACGSTLDHGVLAVGYGTDKGQKYWKVKNSWGSTFGEDGYIRIAKGSALPGGECGIRKGAVFPTVKASVAEIVV